MTVIGFGLSGCSGDSGPSEAEQAAERRAIAAKLKAQDRAKAEKVADSCDSNISDFLNALHEMDSRLSVGLTFASYGERVGDVRVAYDASIAKLTEAADADSLACLGAVAVPAEKALNHYVAASNRWSRCIQDIDCDVDSINGALRSRWRRARQRIDSADAGLKELREPG